MSVAVCPRCQEEVSLPPGIPKEAIVRCPLCREEYSLAEALRSLPPLLEVVELPVGYQAAAELAAQPALAGAAAGSMSRDDFARSLADDDAPPQSASSQSWDMTSPEEPELATAPYEMSSSSLASSGPSVKRQLLHPPGAKKRKPAGSPIGTMIAIVFGGAMAIPCALLILLWLPNGLHKDPFNVAPLLNQHAPYLLPDHLQKAASLSAAAPPQSTKTVKKTASPEKDTSEVEAPQEGPQPAPAAAEGGLDFGSKFEGALQGTTAPEAEAAPPTDSLPGLGDVPEPQIPEPTLPELSGAALPGVDPEMKRDEVATAEPAFPAPLENPLTEGSSADGATSDSEPSPPAPKLARVRQSRENFENRVQEYEIAAAGTDNEARKAAIRAMYQSGAELAGQLPPRAAGMSDVYDSLLADSKRLTFVGLLAGPALDANDREHDGILAFGVVKSCRTGSEMCEIRLQLPSRDNRVITVLGPEVKEGARVLVAGTIVEEPTKVLSDYSSTDPRAISATLIRESGSQ